MTDHAFRRPGPGALFGSILLAALAVAAPAAFSSCSAGKGGAERAAGDTNAAETPGAPMEGLAARKGGIQSKVFTDVMLSPAARMQAEKFNCICGCNLRLAECICEQTPGSIDMKQHLQSLVDAKLSPREIEEGMVAKYGGAVIP